MDGASKDWLIGLTLSASQVCPKDKEPEWTVTTSKNKYFARSTLEQDGSSIICDGYFDQEDQRQDVIIKLIKDWRNYDYVTNETKVLRHLWAETDLNQMHLPILFDQFRLSDKRMGIVLSHFDGYNLDMVRKHPLYVNGVPDYHGAWMLSRMLAVVGYAHFRGVIHANIKPSHVLIRPYDHNACLIDWSCALLNEYYPLSFIGFKTMNEKFSAPEVSKNETPLPSTDLYSIGKCMIYLLGGNLEDNSMPDGVDIRFQRFIKNLLMESPYQRARDAWETLAKLSELRVEIWGPENFVPFEW